MGSWEVMEPWQNCGVLLSFYEEEGHGILDKQSLLQCVERVLSKGKLGLFKEVKRVKEHAYRNLYAHPHPANAPPGSAG